MTKQSEYAGADWIRESLKKPLSAIGEKAANILGEAYQGIYHLPHGSLRTTDWNDPHLCEVWVYDDIATWDGNALTTLVILAHDECVRLAIRVHNQRRLRLWFSPRDREAKSSSYRHPTIEEAIKRARGER